MKIAHRIAMMFSLFVAMPVWGTTSISFYPVYSQGQAGVVLMKSVDGKTTYWVGGKPLMSLIHIKKINSDTTKPLSEDFKKELEAKLGGQVKIGPEDYQNSFMITLNDADAQQFSTMTKDQVGNLIAIVVDGIVLSVPRIHEPITGGAFRLQNTTPKIVEEISQMAN